MDLKPDYQLLFQSSLVPYVILSKDHIVIDVNDAFLKTTSLSRKQLMGQLVPPHIHLEKSERAGAIDLPYQLYRLKNPIHPTQLVPPSPDQELQIVVDELEKLFSLSIDMLCIAKFDGYFKRVSPAIQRVLGYTPEEFCSRPYTDFLHPDDLNRTLEEVNRQLKTGQPVLQFENRYRHKDGSYKALSWTSAPANGLMFGSARDVTEERQREAEIKLLNSSLEQKNSELALVNGELESFTSSVSHDLRAPIRTILGFSNILLEDYRNLLHGQGENYLNRIITVAQKMSELIDELLSLSKITRQEMHRSDTDLSLMATNIANELREAYPQQKVNFHVTPGLISNADPRLMNILLVNLIGNAWKYSSKKAVSQIEFGFDLAKKAFFVKDNGAGFDMNHYAKLFTAFERLHTTKEFEGTGVGLATAHRIIQRHHGNIWAEGIEGEGATFFFTLESDSETTKI